jgi:hypothetical protein
MTQLYFIFNQYLNNLFLEPKDYITEVEGKEGLEFAGKFYQFWRQYERQVFTKFDSYGLTLPSEWHVYFVYSKNRVIPMSSPLILHIQEDMHDTVSTLIHELTHLMLLTDNMRQDNKLFSIWDYLYQEFKGESEQVIEHLIVNAIVKDILSDIFPPKEITKIIDYEKTLFGAGLARAWSILEAPTLNYLPEENLFDMN